MFKCTDPGMQDIIIRGKDTSVLKFSVGYHMTSEADGIDLFNQPSAILENLDAELDITYNTLVKSGSLYKVPYHLLFQTLWDGTYGEHAQLFVNAGEIQGVIYA